jgi:hypothetical protein
MLEYEIPLEEDVKRRPRLHLERRRAMALAHQVQYVGERNGSPLESDSFGTSDPRQPTRFILQGRNARLPNAHHVHLVGAGAAVVLSNGGGPRPTISDFASWIHRCRLYSRCRDHRRRKQGAQWH